MLNPPVKPSRPPIVPGRPVLPSARDSDPALRAVRTLAKRWNTGSEATWSTLVAEAEDRSKVPPSALEAAEEPPLAVNVPDLVHAPEDLALANALLRYYNRSMDIDFGAASQWRGGSTIALAQVVSSATRNANVTSVQGALPPLAVDTLNTALQSTSRWRDRQLQQKLSKQREVEIEKIEEELKVEERERKKMFYETWRQRLRMQGLEKQQRLDLIAEADDEHDELERAAAASFEDAQSRTRQRRERWLALYRDLDDDMSDARGKTESQEASERNTILRTERRTHFELQQALRAWGKKCSAEAQVMRSQEYEARKKIIIERREEWRVIDAERQQSWQKFEDAQQRRRERAEAEERRRREEQRARERQARIEEQLREDCEDAEQDGRRQIENDLAKAHEALLRADFESRNQAKSRAHARVAAEKRRRQYLHEDRAMPKIALTVDSAASYAQNTFGTPAVFMPCADLTMQMPVPIHIMPSNEVAAKLEILGGRIVVSNLGERSRDTETVAVSLQAYDEDAAHRRAVRCTVSDDGPRRAGSSALPSSPTSPRNAPTRSASSTRASATPGARSHSGFDNAQQSPDAQQQQPEIEPPQSAAEARERMSISDCGTMVYLDTQVIARLAFARPCDAEHLEAEADKGDAEASLRAEVESKAAAGRIFLGGNDDDETKNDDRFAAAAGTDFGAEHVSSESSRASSAPFKSMTPSASTTPPPEPANDAAASAGDSTDDKPTPADAAAADGGDDGDAAPPAADRKSDDDAASDAADAAGPSPPAEPQPWVSPVLWSCDIEPGTSVLAVRALLQSLAYRNALYTGYNIPEELHTTKLTTSVHISTRMSASDEEAHITQIVRGTTTISLVAPLIAAPRQPQHTFMEDGDPLRVFDKFALYTPNAAHRWASFSKTDNDRAEAAGINAGALSFTVSIDVYDRGDAIVFDDRDRQYNLTEPRVDNGSLTSLASSGVYSGGSADVDLGAPMAYIMCGAHRIARVFGPLQAWSRLKGLGSGSGEAASDFAGLSLQSTSVTVHMVDGPVTTTTLFNDVLRRIAFTNCTADPMDGRRRLRLDLTDHRTARTGSVERRIRVVPVDDITEMAMNQISLVVYRCQPTTAIHMKPFVPPEPPVYVGPAATVTDPDSDEFVGGWLEIEVTKGGMAGDYLYCLPHPEGHEDHVEVEVEQEVDDNGESRPQTVLRQGRYSMVVTRGHVLTGVPQQYVKRDTGVRRRRSVNPLSGSVLATATSADQSQSTKSMDDTPPALQHTKSTVLEPPRQDSMAPSERSAIETVKSLNARPRTPPREDSRHERRVFLRFEVQTATCDFIQSVVRSIAFKATEKQLGVRNIEFRLVAGDPFEIKFRKFDPFEPIVATAVLGVCEPLIHLSQKAIVYREGMGLMSLPAIGVLDESSLGYRPWSGGWIEVAIINGFSPEEDKVSMRSLDQAVTDTSITLVEGVPDHVRDADFVLAIQREQKEKNTGRRDRTEELTMAAVQRHMAGLKPVDRSVFERQYDLLNYERTAVGRMRSTYQTFRIALRDDMERKKPRKGQVVVPASPAHSNSPEPRGGRRDRGKSGAGADLAMSMSMNERRLLQSYHDLDNPGLRRKDIVGMMRQIVFENRSNNPEHVNKVIRVSINDGDPNSTSHLFIDLGIQLVDDVTEIIRANGGVLDYRQGFESAYFAPFGDCKLVDPDSNQFNRGYMTVSLASAGQCEGDTFRFLTLEDQRQPRPDTSQFLPFCKPMKPSTSTAETHEFIFDTQQGLAFILLNDDERVMDQSTGGLNHSGGPDSPTSGAPSKHPSDYSPLQEARRLKRMQSIANTSSIMDPDGALTDTLSIARSNSMVFRSKYRDSAGNPMVPHPIGTITLANDRRSDKGIQIGVHFLPEGDLVPEVSLAMVENLLRCVCFHNTSKPSKVRTGNRSFIAKVNPGAGAEDGKAKVTALVSPSLVSFAELTQEPKPQVYRKRQGALFPLGRFVVTQDLLLKHGFVCIEVIDGLVAGDVVKADVGPSRPFSLKAGKSLYTSKDLYCGQFGALDAAADSDLPSPGFMLVFDNMSRISGSIVQQLVRSFHFSSTARTQEPGSRVVRVTISDGTINQVCQLRQTIYVEVDDDSIECTLGKFTGQPVAAMVVRSDDPPSSPKNDADSPAAGLPPAHADATERLSRPTMCFPDATVPPEAASSDSTDGGASSTSGRVLQPPLVLEVEAGSPNDQLTVESAVVRLDTARGEVRVGEKVIAKLQNQSGPPPPPPPADGKPSGAGDGRFGDDVPDMIDSETVTPTTGTRAPPGEESSSASPMSKPPRPSSSQQQGLGGSVTPGGTGLPQTKREYELAVAAAAQRVRTMAPGELKSSRLAIFFVDCDVEDLEELLRAIRVSVHVPPPSDLPPMPAPPGKAPPPGLLARTTIKAALLSHRQAAPLLKLSATVEAVDETLCVASASAISPHMELFPAATLKYPARAIRVAWRPLVPEPEPGSDQRPIKVTPLSLITNARTGISRRGNDYQHEKDRVATLVAAHMPANGVVDPTATSSGGKPQPASDESPDLSHRLLSSECDHEGMSFESFLEIEFVRRGTTLPITQKMLRAIAAAPAPAGAMAFNVPYRVRLEIEAGPECVQVIECDIEIAANRKAVEKKIHRRKSTAPPPASKSEPSKADSEPPAP